MKDKILPHSKFHWILGASALLIALCAATFSVYGISTLFAGAAASTIVMASSLEIGKLVGVTFLYRYWKKCKAFLKSYLVVASLILMVITSLGIFGYLSAAYQKSSIEYGVTQEKIKTTEQQIAFSQQTIDSLIALRSSQNTNQMNEFVVRSPIQFRQFQQQIADTDANIEKETKRKQELMDSVNKLKIGTAEKKDVQVYKFVADALGVPLDRVARWFILMIIVVFDPFAIGLILAYNVAVYKKEDDRVYDDIEPAPESTIQMSTNEKPLQEEIKPEVKSEEKQVTNEIEAQKHNALFNNPFFKAYFKK